MICHFDRREKSYILLILLILAVTDFSLTLEMTNYLEGS